MINNSSKKNNGITLIALVITIIVLLILAGISINIILGNDGIISKSKDAHKKTQEEAYIEEVKLKLVDYVIGESVTPTGSYIEDTIEGFEYIDSSEDYKGYYEILKYKEKDVKVYFDDNYNVIDIELVEEHEYNNNNSSLMIKVNSGDSGKVELPITADNNIIVDWGDGIETKYPIETSDIKEVGKVASLREYKKLAAAEAPEGITHEYNQANKEYIVSISGELTHLGTDSEGISIATGRRESIIEILSWGNVGLKKINLQDCENLVRIASPDKDSFLWLVDLSWAFDSCVNLEYIPNDFFDNCPKLENLKRAFSWCEKLTGEAPKVWLKVENGESNSYEGIPNGMDCFMGCEGLSNYEEIPVYWKQAK